LRWIWSEAEVFTPHARHVNNHALFQIRAVTSLALLLIGFSLFNALTLALTHFRHENYQYLPMARIMGLMLLLTLCGLQLSHFVWIYLNHAWIETTLYRMTLFAVAPIFFLFSQPLLRPQN
jgi:hypothetical protein